MKRLIFLVCSVLASCSPARAVDTLTGNLIVQKSVVLQGVISPTQITADQNDYAPTGFATAATVRLSTDASRIVTGLAGGALGRLIAIYNVGDFNLVLANENAGSTAANRFSLGSSVTLTPNTGLVLQYDATTARWRAQGAPSSGGGGVTLFTELSDVPQSYSGASLKVVRVNAGETGLEFTSGGGGSTAWGDISGTLSNQTDLQSALNAKQATGSYITGLTGDVTASGPGSVSSTVTKINGTALSGLATGILKNTTTTGVPSIAVAGDFPTLNQNTSGSAATLTTGRTIALTGDVTYTSGSFNGSGNVTGTATLAAGNAGNLNSGTLLAARMPALTGDVTTSAGAVATTIGTNAVTNAKAAQMATLTIKGNNTGGTANAADLTVSQVNSMLGTFSNPMTTAGDIIYGGASGVPTRKAQGGNGTFLGVSGGVLDYYTPAGGGNVSNTGTPTSGQVATWTSATVIQGVGVTTLSDSMLGLSGNGFVKRTGTNAYTNDTSTYLTANQTVTLSGDVTGSGATAITATLANIPTGTPMAGSILATNIAAPSSPASGKVSIFTDSTDLRFHDKNASGVIGTTVVADTGASNNFLTAISAAGAISKAQPAFSNLSGSVAAGQMPALTGDATTSAGTVAVTVGKINGTSLAGLATGILKNTTTTGVPSIAVAGDFPTLNQNTTGSAATLTTPRAINGVNFDGSAAITVTAAAGTLSGATLASGVTASSLTSTGALTSGSIDTGFVVKGVTMTLGSDANYDLYYRNSSGVLTRLANGSTGQFLAATTSNAPSWGTPSGSGTVTNTGTLTANRVILGNGTSDVTTTAGITTDGTSVLNLGVNATTLGKMKLFGNTSGDATVQPAAVAGTATVVTLPNASSTLPIFGQQITFTGPTAARTITLPDAAFTAARTDAGQTFTGTNIFASLNVVGTSNSFTSKFQIDDGAWSAGRIITFIPGSNANANVTFPTGTFTIARQDGTNTFIGVQTMTSPDLTTPLIKGATSSGSTSIDFSGNSGTFKTTTGATTLGSSATVNGANISNEIPQNIQTGNYTLVLADAGKQIYATSGSSGTWTIPANASVAFPIGTAVTFVVKSSTITVAITSDTLSWAPTGATGSRTLSTSGITIATVVKISSTEWVISGSGVTYNFHRLHLGEPGHEMLAEIHEFEPQWAKLEEAA